MKLRELIREVVADHRDAQPDELVELVVEATTDEQLRDFYRTAVRSDVMHVINLDRNTAIVNAMTGRPMRQRQPSSRRKNIVGTWWEQALGSPIHTASGYKQYGDCTVDDLDFLVKERRSHIADVEFHINLHLQNRERMIELGVNRVRDLPAPEEAA